MFRAVARSFLAIGSLLARFRCGCEQNSTRHRAAFFLSRRNAMKVTLSAVAVVVAMIVGLRIEAHHSFAATYFEDRTMQIEGKLVQFSFRNPHSFVHVEAPDDKKQMQRWAVEWGGTAALGSRGITNETLKYG